MAMTTLLFASSCWQKCWENTHKTAESCSSHALFFSPHSAFQDARILRNSLGGWESLTNLSRPGTAVRGLIEAPIVWSCGTEQQR